MHSDAAQRIKDVFATAAARHRGGQLGEAARLYETVLQLDPHHADALHFLGVIALQTGRYEQSVHLIGKAIQENGRVPSFYNNLGNALRACGRLQQAAVAFQKALGLNGNAPDTLYNLGVVYQEAGRLEEAMNAYQAVLGAKPEHAGALGNLGNVFNAQGRAADALACYERALANRADDLPSLVNRGNVLKSLGRLDEAAGSYRRAIALDARQAEAHNNLGLVLMESGRLGEAASSYQDALSVQPDYVAAQRNLGHALREQGRPAEAAGAYRRALSLDAEDAEARLGLAMTSIPVFAQTVVQSSGATEAFDDALAQLADWDRESPGRLGKAVGILQPFHLAYRPSDLKPSLSRYGDLVCPAAATYWASAAEVRPVGDTDRSRIRMVMICGHVRAGHPVWQVLVRGLLAHLHRGRLELQLYHTGSVVDRETSWAHSRVDRFVQGPKSTAAWVADLRGQQPDIIFYPEVGMDPVACTLASMRLAPLQVASWGHPATTGLPTIDLFLSGELLESAQSDEHYREKLVRLPGTGACTQTPGDAVRRWDQEPAETGVVRFALPHQPIKFDPADDILLARLAGSVGRCEFWIPSPARLGWATESLSNRLAAVFRREGLDPGAHLRVTPWLPRDEFLGFLDAMDVYLDCVAFSGYTTAWQAVHRGLPIVTLEGRFLRQRLAAGLLRQIEQVDGIAQTREDYVKRAVQFAAESREPLRREQRRRVIRHAATRSNENVAAVEAFERVLIEGAMARVD